MKPTRAGLKVMGVAANALLRTISRVAGADIVRDAVAFFQAFEGMEEGFRVRAARVRELLGQRGHRLRARGLASPGLGRRGRPLRRQADRVVTVGRPRWSSTACSPASPTTPQLATRAAARWGPRRGAPIDDLVENLAGLHRRLGPRGAGLRRPGRQGRAGPGLPDPAPQHRRPRPGRPSARSRTCSSTGHRLTASLRRCRAGANLSAVPSILSPATPPRCGRRSPRSPALRSSTIREARSGPEVMREVAAFPARSGRGRPADGQHGRDGRLPRAPPRGVLRQPRARAGADAARPAAGRVHRPSLGCRGLGGQTARPDPPAAGGRRAAGRGHVLRRVLPASVGRVGPAAGA